MNFVERVALSAGWKPIPVPEDLDTGIDGLLEWEDVGLTQVVAFQVKRGDAYFDDSGPKCQCSGRHLRYWRDHILPVILIVISEDETQAFWMDVREYVRSNTALAEQRSHTIRLSQNQPFGTDALKGPIRRHTRVPALGDAVAALTDTAVERRLSALSLFYRFRFERASPFCLAAALRIERDLDALRVLCDFYSRYLGHPETSFGADTELTRYARFLLGHFPKGQLLRILEAFDDEDQFGDWHGATEIFGMAPDEIWVRHDVIQRGTIQQGIAQVVGAAATAADLLAILGESGVPPRLRRCAAALFGYLGHSCPVEFLDQIAAESRDLPFVALITWLRHWITQESQAPKRS